MEKVCENITVCENCGAFRLEKDMKKYRVTWWDEDDKMEFDIDANNIDDLAVKMYAYLRKEFDAGCMWHIPPSVDVIKMYLDDNERSRMYQEVS